MAQRHEWDALPMKNLQSVAVIMAGFAVASLVPASAADVAPRAAPTGQYLAPAPVSEWVITLGAEARLGPRYEGADSYRVLPFPVFRIRKSTTPEKFRSPRDGASIAIIDQGPFKFGPALKVKTSRKESDDNDLRGLGDVDWTVEVGAFAEYWVTDRLRTRAEVRQGFGGHKGVVADFSADFVMPVTPQLTLSAGPRLTASSGAAVSPYFDVTAAQSVASGLPVYDAGGGIKSYGAGAQAIYAWTPQWSSNVFIEYDRLTGDVADSPLVSLRGKRDQIQVGTGLTYSFNIPALW
jgi:outer membrane protein